MSIESFVRPNLNYRNVDKLIQYDVWVGVMSIESFVRSNHQL